MAAFTEERSMPQTSPSQGNIASTSAAGITTLTGPDGAAIQTPIWCKVGNALAYTTFSAAALFKTNTLFSLPAGGVVHATKIKQSTAFAGPAVATCTLEVGIAGTTDKYASAFDVAQAVSGTAFELGNTAGTESHTAATNITCTLRTTGANTSVLTAGVVDVWALISFPT